ncbi:MAG: hypothetical protein FRX49_13154 [Trebouxia sp. A1-2]|nr:MAG: hypothetical protein FRX49_13154 [Trebouxia sp. A1-2]
MALLATATFPGCAATTVLTPSGASSTPVCCRKACRFKRSLALRPIFFFCLPPDALPPAPAPAPASSGSSAAAAAPALVTAASDAVAAAGDREMGASAGADKDG